MDKSELMEYKDKIPKGIYGHFKGKLYEVLGFACHSETLEPMVVYRALYGERGIWVRPASMWLEAVEHNGKAVARFTYVGEHENDTTPQ
ncbi:MAG: DUF1653 domain-containing protein [Oscillospiraceae bacterium]